MIFEKNKQFVSMVVLELGDDFSEGFDLIVTDVSLARRSVMKRGSPKKVVLNDSRRL